MPKQSEVTLLDYWYATLEVTAGLALSTKAEDKELLKQQLYRARSEAGDEKLNNVVILMPEGKPEVWLVRKDADQHG